MVTRVPTYGLATGFIHHVLTVVGQTQACLAGPMSSSQQVYQENEVYLSGCDFFFFSSLWFEVM